MSEAHRQEKAATDDYFPRPGIAVMSLPRRNAAGRVVVHLTNSRIEGPVGTFEIREDRWLHLPDLDSAQALRDALSAFITYHRGGGGTYE